jgi:uncharacterized protein
MLTPMENFIWILAFAGSGFGAGLLSGVFGVGGGTLVVPLLLMLGISIHHAVGMSLVYILFASASGSYKHYQQGNVHFRSAVIMSLAAFCTIFLGVKLGVALPAKTLSYMFSGLMLLVVGLFAYRIRLTENTPQSQVDASEASTTGTASSTAAKVGLIATGLIAGLFSSLFGVGGGFVMVPLLVIFAGFKIKQAAGTSLVSIFFIALVGIAQHYYFGSLKAALAANIIPMIAMAGAGIVGAPLGAWCNQKLPASLLQKGFMLFILCIMVYMFFYGQAV